MRSHQARLFNQPEGGADVLVASDAIGMGLNLNIRRVVFLTAHKYNASTRKSEPLSTSLVKQIAGRAGRRGTAYELGRVAVLKVGDRAFVEQCLARELPPLERVGLHPTWEQFDEFARELNEGRRAQAAGGIADAALLDPGADDAGDVEDVPFPRLLDHFEGTARVDGATYFLANFATIRTLAAQLEAVRGLTLEERFTLCFAPVTLTMPPVLKAWLTMGNALAAGGTVLLDHAEARALGGEGEVPQVRHGVEFRNRFCLTIFGRCKKHAFGIRSALS